MAWTQFRTVISGCDRSTAGESIAGEAHTIPVGSPYVCRLESIPKINSAASSVFENTYVSLADMATAGIAVTIGGSPATLTDQAAPNAGEVYFQMLEGSERMFSDKLVFNSADAGKAVTVNYTGFASLVDAPKFTALQQAATRLETYAPCHLLSAKTYSGGEYDNTVADDTTLVILGSQGKLKFAADSYTWNTAAIDLSAGDTQVAAFVDTDAWKRIGIYLIDNGGSLAARITETAESVTQIGLDPVEPYDEESFYCGYVDTQGDGTGNAGGIEAIAQSVIVSQQVTLLSSALQGGGLSLLTARTYGALVAGEVLDQAIFPNFAGRVLNIYLTLEDTGSGGDDLKIDVKLSGSSLFANETDKPVIAANSGTFQRDTTPAIDLIATDFTATDYFTFPIDTAPTGAEHATLTIEVLKI